MSAATNTGQVAYSVSVAKRRPLWYVAVGALGIAVVLSIIYVAAAIRWLQQPFPGFTTAYTTVIDGNGPFGTTTWTGIDAGLQRLDQIVAIDGQHIVSDNPLNYTETRQRYHEVLASYEVGNTVTIGFARPQTEMVASGLCTAPVDGTASCETTVTLMSLPLIDQLVYIYFPLIAGIVSIGVGIILVYLRPQQSTALLIAILSATLGTFMVGTFNNSTAHVVLPLWLFTTSMVGGTALVLALMYPTRNTSTYRYPFILGLPPLLALGIAISALWFYYNPSSPRQFSVVWQLPVLFTVFSFVVLFLALVQRRRRVQSTEMRDQINTAFIGIGLTAMPVILWFAETALLFVFQRPILLFNSISVMPFYVAIPMSMTYAVLQYRTGNTDKLLTASITYGIMLASLAVGYGMLVLGVNLMLSAMVGDIGADNPLLIAFVVFFIAALFLPFRTRLQAQIDEIYYRRRREYQNRLEQFSREVSSADGFDDIIKLFRESAEDALMPSSFFIFLPNENGSAYVAHAHSQAETGIRFDANSELVQLLQVHRAPIYLDSDTPWPPELLAERSQLNVLKTSVLAGLQGSGRLTGFVSMGKPRSREQVFGYEEMRHLENISKQMAVSVERAQVVESLEKRVRELGVLSSVSQAVNFAVEFDDLLELISAQTQKLIAATHFYIVLREPSVKQLYFAFFLEGDERYRDRETNRWPISNDLFSEIIRDSKALKIDNYLREITERGTQRLYLDARLKSWMGVPLIAGSNTLGVMAVGTDKMNRAYTDDQLKIFTDITALAATSLDKARLFDETNRRARQLTALNEISQQLASERDIEQLIELITQSAVDILEAEAGSLLLTADDGSGDLEFRVAVGESGQELIGTRLEAGHGLAGKVATEGEPVIVNDTTKDTRWEGEASESFHTHAVLAVPLITNKEVIGVLEVINKRGGGVYVPEDAKLLTTFAGQAAIAIDNARLFQMTDEQLSSRVAELETLEKIDSELNRTLDLKRVAEITVRWAVANSGATAGLLGTVRAGTPPRLEILASYGYSDNDHPEGAENGYWPLDRGIASRVLRTKRLDIQPDVSIDFDYVPSLRRSNSQITVPMLSGGEITSMLILEKSTEPRLNIIDGDFVQRLAEHAAIAIDNARLYQELARVNESQSEFMSFVAHELKNPLTSIKGYSEVIQSTAADGTAGGFAGTILNNANRMQTIINDLKDHAAIIANRLEVNTEPMNFRKVVVETLRPFIKQIEDKNQTLINKVEDDLPLIMGDENRLIQVLTNFVSNAHKYSPQGATITIDAVVERNKKDRNGAVMGDFLHISVADTGIGMSQEDLNKLFTPYFRSENDAAQQQPGTGLGMTITRSLIIQHDGEVWVESTLGEGSTFHFTVPLATEEEIAEPSAD